MEDNRERGNGSAKAQGGKGDMVRKRIIFAVLSQRFGGKKAKEGSQGITLLKGGNRAVEKEKGSGKKKGNGTSERKMKNMKRGE